MHIAAICDPGNSHVMNFAAIGRELQKRGHRFTAFHVPELEPKIRREGIGFQALESRGFSVAQYENLIVQQEGASVRNFLEYASKSATMLCEEGPRAFREAGVDGVIVDMSEPGGATAAEAAGLPYVTICNAVPLHSEPDVPPDFLPWNYHRSLWARMRNRLAYAVRDWMIRPLHAVLNGYRAQWGLRPYHSPDDSFSALEIGRAHV